MRTLSDPQSDTAFSRFLPYQRTSLIGREKDVTTLCALLQRDDVGLVTLTGPGGTGKTRLAIEVARQMADQFPDGVFFVDLAPVGDPDLVATAIVSVLDLKDRGGGTVNDMVFDYLQNRSLLLILDNFEQVLTASLLVAALLTSCRDLKILVTSREPLHLREEREYRVPPLGLPGAVSSAREDLMLVPSVALFMQRAQAAVPDFDSTRAQAEIVAEICERLDGLPLAIELAAARLRVLSPVALLHRLEHRLTVLTGGPHDLPVRQQTLRSEIAWSIDLLSEADQQFFMRLAVFTGSFSLSAAEGLADPSYDALQGVSSLVEKSLLRRADETASTEPRFSMLATIREYALEALTASGEGPRCRRAHAEHFLRQVAGVERDLRGPDQWVWLAKMDLDRDNFRAALAWCQTDEAFHTSGEMQSDELGLRLAVELANYCWNQGYGTTGRGWLSGALRTAERSKPYRPALIILRARALHWLGMLTFFLVGPTQARMPLEESHAISVSEQDNMGIAISGGLLSWCFAIAGDGSQSRSLGEQAVAAARLLNEPWYLAVTLFLTSTGLEDGTQQIARAEEALSIIRSIGTPATNAAILSLVGALSVQKGDLDRAVHCYDECLAIGRESRLLWHTEALHGLGDVALARGDLAKAAEYFAESLSLSREWGRPRFVILAASDLGRVALANGQPARAARLFGAADALGGDDGIPTFLMRRRLVRDAIVGARVALGETAFRDEWQAGRNMSIEALVAEALTVSIVPLTPTGFPAGLSGREVEVLQLLAAGRSNRNIAETLVISLNTVLRHVTNIYSKLGVNNRVEATNFAVHHGLSR